MSFNKNACIIRTVYCGEGKVPKDTAVKKYSRKGTNYECLKKGFGVADWQHRKVGLPAGSLQNIKYVGPVYAEKFRKKKITSIKTLQAKLAPLTAAEKRTLLRASCQRANGVVDQRAINSILLFLHEKGMKNLPNCKIVRE